MSERIQPLCPIREDERCMGAACAWSSKHVREDGVYVFTCGVTDRREGQHPIIDTRQSTRVEVF